MIISYLYDTTPPPPVTHTWRPCLLLANHCSHTSAASSPHLSPLGTYRYNVIFAPLMYSPSQLLERLLRTSLMTKSGINIFGDCCLSPIQCSVYQLLHWQKFITSLQALPFFRSVIPLELTQKVGSLTCKKWPLIIDLAHSWVTGIAFVQIVQCAQKDVMHLCHLQLVIIWSLDLNPECKWANDLKGWKCWDQHSPHVFAEADTCSSCDQCAKNPCKIILFNSWKSSQYQNMLALQSCVLSKMHFQIPSTCEGTSENIVLVFPGMIFH